MVGGIVHHDYVGLTPTRPVSIELQHQLTEEDLHDLRVAVGLEQAQVDSSIRVKADDHANSRHHQLAGYGIGGSSGPPLHPPEIGHAEPSVENGGNG